MTYYAIGIIITAYLPIFTLQSVEGRLFKPMAWTVAFALLGALIFSMVLTPVLSSFLFRRGAREWSNPILAWLADGYKRTAAFAIRNRYLTVALRASPLHYRLIWRSATIDDSRSMLLHLYFGLPSASRNLRTLASMILTSGEFGVGALAESDSSVCSSTPGVRKPVLVCS